MSAPLNAACSPIGAHSEPRRRYSQPRTRATGMREANPTRASPNASPAVAPVMFRTWAKAKNSAPRSSARPRPDGPCPGRRGEAAEEQLLGDRGQHRAGQQVEQQPQRHRRSGGSGLAGVTGTSWARIAGHDDRDDDDRPGPQRPGRQLHDRPPVEPPDAHVRPAERAGIDHEQPDERHVHDGLDDQRRDRAERAAQVDARRPTAARRPRSPTRNETANAATTTRNGDGPA